MFQTITKGIPLYRTEIINAYWHHLMKVTEPELQFLNLWKWKSDRLDAPSNLKLSDSIDQFSIYYSTKKLKLPQNVILSIILNRKFQLYTM